MVTTALREHGGWLLIMFIYKIINTNYTLRKSLVIKVVQTTEETRDKQV